MNKQKQHPLEQGAAAALPTVGEGCLQRFDPEALSSDHGTEFPDAQQAWQRYLEAQQIESAQGISASSKKQHADPNGDKQ